MPGITPAQASGRRNRQSHQPALTSSPRPSRLAGRIMWLPKKEDLDIDVGLSQGCYNHPVVILSPEVSDDDVDILIVTSFGRTDLATRHPDNPRMRAFYLPIHPSPPHPENAKLLHLLPGQALDRRSYIETKGKHTIPFVILRPYRVNKEHVLRPASYQELVEYAQYTPATLPGLEQGIVSQPPPPLITEGRLDRHHRTAPPARDRSPSTPRPPPIPYRDVLPQIAHASSDARLFGRQGRRVADEENTLYQPGLSYGTVAPHSQYDRRAATRVASLYGDYEARRPLGGHPRAGRRRTTVPGDESGYPMISALFVLLVVAGVTGFACYGVYWTGLRVVDVVRKLAAWISTLPWSDIAGFIRALPGRVWEWMKSLIPTGQGSRMKGLVSAPWNLMKRMM
ncbi:hypothetical protein B0T19DRAFT_230051 [Cercophora scortea]|uniref:Uncharacterized protein n=1 Tax=Cercophora scortea TaxID=314031 RepID=A0AAE0MAC9_9PEZI|nr:hypothetical protein B0T19DRAFT_230051 [Cercophora scortea]